MKHLQTHRGNLSLCHVVLRDNVCQATALHVLHHNPDIILPNVRLNVLHHVLVRLVYFAHAYLVHNQVLSDLSSKVDLFDSYKLAIVFVGYSLRFINWTGGSVCLKKIGDQYHTRETDSNPHHIVRAIEFDLKCTYPSPIFTISVYTVQGSSCLHSLFSSAIASGVDMALFVGRLRSDCLVDAGLLCCGCGIVSAAAAVAGIAGGGWFLSISA